MIPLAGTVWSVVPAGTDPRRCPDTPEGAFHHAGQRALYTALTAEGAIALRWPLAHPDDPAQDVAPLQVRLARVADARTDPRPAMSWQDARRRGEPGPAWALIDAARAGGAEGMLWRKGPHDYLVLFETAAAAAVIAGPAQSFPRVPPMNDYDLYH